MNAVIMNSAGDYNRWIGNPKRNSGTHRASFPYRSDDLLLASFLAGGHFGGLVFRPPQTLQHYRHQPPLLPLPVSVPLNHQNINISRSNSTTSNINNIRLSSSPRIINKNIKNRGRDHSLTPKKSKNQKKDSKKEVTDLLPPASESSINQMTGPDLEDLPNEVVISRVLSSSINKKLCDIDMVSVDEFSGCAVFSPSPPPSSLPFPTFCLRSKLSCKAAVASGVDVGATDGLRRLLRL